MGSCNTTQNELGGKQLLLKACKQGNVASTATSATLTSVGHGLKVGDIVKPTQVGANTTIVVGTLYVVKTVPTVDTFTISATLGGAAIIADDSEAVMVWDLFKAVGGIRSKSLSFSSEGIDITNEESDEWKTMLDLAGIRSMEVSGSGVYSSYDMVSYLEAQALANSLTCLMFLSPKTGRVYSGCFKLTSFEVSGDYDAESNFSISASSSGAIGLVTIAP